MSHVEMRMETVCFSLGFFTSSSSLIAESEETLVYLFILGRDVYLNICTCTGDVGFMILAFVCFMLGVTGRCSPPPPTAPHTVCSKYSCVEVFYFILWWRERGGMCGGTMYSLL